MAIGHLLTQPLTIQTVGGTTTDDYGDVTPLPVGDPTSVMGYLFQSETTEYLNDRETTVSKWFVFLPATAVVSPMDYINFDSQQFQVDGEPHHVYNPRLAVVDHIECKLIVVS